MIHAILSQLKCLSGLTGLTGLTVHVSILKKGESKTNMLS